MPFSIKDILRERSGENYTLHSQYINPQFAKVLQTIGFDKCYERAEGPYLYDKSGERYLDFLAGYGVFGLGRNHPKIKEVIREFLDQDTASLVQMEAPLLSGLLAEALVKQINIPALDTVYLTNSGTESNETAIKFARCATARPRILFLKKAFHGLSTGSLALNGGTEFRDGFGALLPGCDAVEMNNLDQLASELKKQDVAAFFVEPIQGKGVFMPQDDYLPSAQELCKKFGTLLVVDEIQTGLGRTGKWFAYEHWGLKPDIITIAKTLSGGMVPVGAVITNREIYDRVFSRMDRCVVHSSTFGQNNLAMVCGLATLEILKDEKLIEASKKYGDMLLQELQKRKESSEWIKDVRGKGLMIGIEFGEPVSFKNKMKWKMIHGIDRGLFGELIVMPLMQNHRILTQVTGHHQDIVKLLPPFVITEKDVATFLTGFDQVMEECGRLSGPLWDMGSKIAKHALANQKLINQKTKRAG